MTTLVKRPPRFLRRAQRLVERRYSPASNLNAPGFTASMSVPSVAGVLVTPQTALTFCAFYAAVRVIAEDMASLPLAMFRKTANGGCELMRDHRVTYLFNRSPDGECNDMNWRESYVSHVLGWGNGYSEIEWTGGGELDKLNLIHPSVILPKREPRTGQLYYELTTANAAGGGSGKRVAYPWQILHFAGLGFNGLVGYSPVALMREAIGMGKAMEQYGASFFGNGAMPGGVVEFARQMKPEALKNFRESWNLVHQGSAGSHKVALLEEGAKWQSTQIPPETAQFLLSRSFQVIEICRIFRLPPHKLADYTNAHLDNIEASNIDYEKTCLRPWTIRLEKTIDFKLLTEDEWAAGFYCKHDFRPLLLRTSKDMADYYKKMFQIGYYTVDEMKALEGSNPIGEAAGGGKRFVQAQLIDLTKAGDPEAAKEAKVPPGQPGRPERSLRCDNPIQDEKGQFAGCAPGGGSKGDSAGGGGSGAASPADQPTKEIVAEITAGHDDAGLQDHPDVAVLKEEAKAEIDATKSEQKAELKETAKDQAGEVKELQKDHAAEAKSLEKDHVAEDKELARDQAKELKDQAREHEQEAKDLPESQAQELKDLEKDHAKERAELAKDHEKELAELAKDPEATPEAIADAKKDHEQQHADLKEQHKDAIEGTKEEHAQNAANLKESQAQALQEMKDEHAAALAEQKERQAQEKKDQAAEHAEALQALKGDHADALTDLKAEHAEKWQEIIPGWKDEYKATIDRLKAKQEAKSLPRLAFAQSNGVAHYEQ